VPWFLPSSPPISFAIANGARVERSSEHETLRACGATPGDRDAQRRRARHRNGRSATRSGGKERWIAGGGGRRERDNAESEETRLGTTTRTAHRASLADATASPEIARFSRFRDRVHGVALLRESSSSSSSSSTSGPWQSRARDSSVSLRPNLTIVQRHTCLPASRVRFSARRTRDSSNGYFGDSPSLSLYPLLSLSLPFSPPCRSSSVRPSRTLRVSLFLSFSLSSALLTSALVTRTLTPGLFRGTASNLLHPRCIIVGTCAMRARSLRRSRVKGLRTAAHDQRIGPRARRMRDRGEPPHETDRNREIFASLRGDLDLSIDRSRSSHYAYRDVFRSRFREVCSFLSAAPDSFLVLSRGASTDKRAREFNGITWDRASTRSDLARGNFTSSFSIPGLN